MPARPNRDSRHKAKPPGKIVTCPSCGRKGEVAKTTGPVRCSDCGKEFKPGAGIAAPWTIIAIILALAVMAGVAYFAVSRAGRIDAEEKAKAAADERLRQPLEKGK
jgi:hypothetical protein